MMNQNVTELAVEVKARLNIPDTTIERCLKLVEMWLEDNPDKRISGGYRSGGKILPFRIERRDDD